MIVNDNDNDGHSHSNSNSNNDNRVQAGGEGAAVRTRTSEPGRFHDASYSSLRTRTASRRLTEQSALNWIGSDGGSYSYLRTSTRKQ